MKSTTPLIFVPIHSHSVIKYQDYKQLHKQGEADSKHFGKRPTQADTPCQIPVQDWVLKLSLNDFTESLTSAELSTKKTCTKGEILCQTTSLQDREVHDSKE